MDEMSWCSSRTLHTTESHGQRFFAYADDGVRPEIEKARGRLTKRARGPPTRPPDDNNDVRVYAAYYGNRETGDNRSNRPMTAIVIEISKFDNCIRERNKITRYAGSELGKRVFARCYRISKTFESGREILGVKGIFLNVDEYLRREWALLGLGKLKYGSSA